MRIIFIMISGQKMTGKDFGSFGQKMSIEKSISKRTQNVHRKSLSPYGSDLNSRHTQGRFLEHSACGHFDTLKAFELECCKGWIMLNDGVTMLVCEDREVILRAQVCLILCTLLIACERIVFHTQGHKTLVLKVAHWESQIDLYEVCVGDNVLLANERRVESIEKISGWERRKHRRSLVVSCCRSIHSGLVVSVVSSHVYILCGGVG